MEKKEMLQALIEHYDNGNKSQFAKRLGISAQGVSTWLSRGTLDIETIFAKCEGVNPEWLLTGEGAMLNDDEKKTIPSPRMVEVTAEAWDIIKKQAESLASKDRQVEELIKLLKKNNAHQEENAGCAAVSSSDLVK